MLYKPPFRAHPDQLCTAALSGMTLAVCRTSTATSRERASLSTIRSGIFIDVAEVRTEEGKLYLFVGIGRTAKFAYWSYMKSQTEQ